MIPTARRYDVAVVEGEAAEQGVRRVELVVHAGVELILPGLLFRAHRKVIDQARLLCSGPEIHQLRADRIHRAGGNLVGRVRSPRGGIVYGAQAGEVAGSHRERWNEAGEGDALPQPETFVIAEKEGVALPDGAAEAAAELVLLECRRGARAGEEVLGVHLFVAKELEEASMEVTGPGLGDQVDDAAGGAAEFRGVAVGDELEFGERVHGGLHDDRADITLVVVEAVDHEVVVVSVLAVDGHGSAGTTVIRAVAALQRVVAVLVGAHGELRQADEVPAVQREVLHGALINQRAERGTVGLQRGCLRRHLYGLGNLTDCEA